MSNVYGFFTLFVLFMLLRFPLSAQRILEPDELKQKPVYRSLTEALANPDSVYRLSLKGQKLKSFPAEIFKLRNLHSLDMSRNRLSEIPDSIGVLVSLVEINFGYNRLTTLPHTIGNLKNLMVLKLHKNRIASLPPETGNLVYLEILELWDNEIDVFPEEMKACKLLKKMDLRGILMTDEKQHAIQAIFPNTRIYFSPPCACKD